MGDMKSTAHRPGGDDGRRLEVRLQGVCRNPEGQFNTFKELFKALSIYIKTSSPLLKSTQLLRL